jgi:hypothetical protein
MNLELPKEWNLVSFGNILFLKNEFVLFSLLCYHIYFRFA